MTEEGGKINRGRETMSCPLICHRLKYDVPRGLHISMSEGSSGKRNKSSYFRVHQKWSWVRYILQNRCFDKPWIKSSASAIKRNQNCICASYLVVCQWTEHLSLAYLTSTNPWTQTGPLLMPSIHQTTEMHKPIPSKKCLDKQIWITKS